MIVVYNGRLVPLALTAVHDPTGLSRCEPSGRGRTSEVRENGKSKSLEDEALVAMVTYFIGFLAPIKAFDRFIPEGFTPVPLNQRHLTLIYLGSCEELNKLSEEVKAIPPLSVFTVTFRGLGAFPSLSKPRYLAALPSKESVKVLERVHNEISNRIRAHSDKYSDFRPHVSVAYTRMKPTLELRIKVERVIRAGRSAIDSIEIHEFYLMKAAAGEVKPLLKLGLL